PAEMPHLETHWIAREMNCVNVLRLGSAVAEYHFAFGIVAGVRVRNARQKNFLPRVALDIVSTHPTLRVVRAAVRFIQNPAAGDDLMTHFAVLIVRTQMLVPAAVYVD